MKKYYFALVFTLVLAINASANTHYNVCYGTLDGNYDGELTRQEFKDAFPKTDMTPFEQADTDTSNTVSHEEWEQWKSSQGFEHDDE